MGPPYLLLDPPDYDTDLYDASWHWIATWQDRDGVKQARFEINWN